RSLSSDSTHTAPPTHSRHALGDGACQRTRSRPGRGLTEAGARGHRDPATLLSTAGTAGAAPSPLWCMLDSRASRTVSDTPICAPVAPTLFISDADVATLADWRSAVAGLAAAYAADVKPAMVPPRSMARGEGIWLRGLTAVSPSGATMGCKLIAASPRARRASYLISLFDQGTMALSALIDGNRVTGLRTAA